MSKLQCAEKLGFFWLMKTWKILGANLWLHLVHTGYPIYVVVAIFELDMQAMLIRSNVRGTNYSVLG